VRGTRRATFVVSTIRIPPQLVDAVDEDDSPARLEWLAALPAQVREIASVWELELGHPYVPGGQCAWVAPARNPAGDELVLKLGWRHREAEHEAEGLAHWDGDGAVRCFASRQLDTTHPCSHWRGASHPDHPLSVTAGGTRLTVGWRVRQSSKVTADVALNMTLGHCRRE
jgi:streptomycin 6-kinase